MISTKGVQILQRALYKSALCLKRNSPTILSCIGAAGVIATTVIAVKATPKAMAKIQNDSRRNHGGNPYAYSKVEAVQSAWRYYIPATAIGLSTIACIFGSNALNRRQQAALTSAYILLENSYKEYKNKVKGSFGDDADKLIRESIVKDHSIGYKRESADDTELFFEYNYGELFERHREDVLKAEYEFNLLFASRGYATLNDLYELLGLPRTREGEVFGWSLGDDIYECPWVDFEHELVEMEDGMECYIISTSIPPTIDYM